MTAVTRIAAVNRKTNETDIHIEVNLDGQGVATVSSGIGFFDHMLTHIARHANMDLTVTCEGDLHIDDHHTVEDVGIAIGQAIAQALGDKAGIVRAGQCTMPMDEALVACALDISGRGFLAEDFVLNTPKLGDYTTELTTEFFRAVAMNAGITLHFMQLRGNNSHHIIESAFKAFARALAMAASRSARVTGIPSTKGVL